MARIRTLKPDFFSSEDVHALDFGARLTFLGLWTYVDDEGRGRADPRLIKAAVWPIEDGVSADDVDDHIRQATKRGMVCTYEVGGTSYLHVVNFDVHQRINRPTASKIPPCPHRTHGGLTEPSVSAHGDADVRQESPTQGSLFPGETAFTEDSLSPPGAITEGSPPEQGKGTGNREKEQGTGKAPRGASAEPDRFDEFWSAYPRREAKATARKAWDKAIKNVDPGVIIAAAKQYAARPGREEKYTAHPSTWLNGERWNDETPAAPPPDRPPNGYQPFRNIGAAKIAESWK